MDNYNIIDISVRDLVEFTARAGNIDNRRSSFKELDAMRRGTRMHAKIQKSMGDNYRAEVSLKHSSTILRDGNEFVITTSGRADGIVKPDKSESCDKSYVEIDGNNYSDLSKEEDISFLQYLIDNNDTKGIFHIFEKTEESREESVKIKEDKDIYIIDEIKCVLRDLDRIKHPVSFHRAQAMCYAWFYCEDNNLSEIAIRITYCNLDTGICKYFGEVFSYGYLEKWYNFLLMEYAKWAAFQLEWNKKRDITIKNLDFPFEYRQGQREFVKSVYLTIIRDKKIFIQAPTGAGKTISTIFPAVKAIGEKQIEKIFYITAKNITRTAAEETFRILRKAKALIKTVNITAKEKICILEKPDCNPEACERAKGHFDRVNDAVYDLINHEDDITREVILLYAERYKVCPFEMCLDVSLWVDAVICDYNYVFDPRAYLRRFFEIQTKKKYAVLVDEAHNLVDRACDMYSASVVKEDFLKVKKIIENVSKKSTKAIDNCNKELLKFKRECEGMNIYEDIYVVDKLVLLFDRLINVLNDFFNENDNYEGKDEVFNLYFDIRHFSDMFDNASDDYLVYTHFRENGDFELRLNCMNPARNIGMQLEKVKSSILFSATLLPITYYKEQLSGNRTDYDFYADTPFEKHKRMILVADNISTRYTRRGEKEYRKIAEYIRIFVNSKCGNYLIFFPSYRFLENVYEYMDEDTKEYVIIQKQGMSEEDKEIFLSEFVANPSVTKAGMCVLGGVFSEGIDLKNDRLIGVCIVGTGLPMVCDEREIYRNYYDNYNNNGFSYAYLYNGMNKVLQAAGRVIRTVDDMGVILLLDERFLTAQYKNLFPREWFPYYVINENILNEKLEEFLNIEGGY
ncbi:MAG: ATP-dependent DNA helicase [Lachnospiraceae bacterium]|nr:ATP-dependent DNA helicase [Lachnospiraceae bacterium]